MWLQGCSPFLALPHGIDETAVRSRRFALPSISDEPKKLGATSAQNQPQMRSKQGFRGVKGNRINGTLAEACGSRTHLRSPRRARTAALKAARTTGPHAPPQILNERGCGDRTLISVRVQRQATHSGCPRRNYRGEHGCIQLFAAIPANFLRASSRSFGSVQTS